MVDSAIPTTTPVVISTAPPPLFAESGLGRFLLTAGAYAQIDDANARKLVRGCSLPQEVKAPDAPVSQIVVQFTVSAEGKLLTVHHVQGPLTHQLGARLAGCYFKPYKVNGVKTAFQANVIFNVKP